MTSLAAMTAVAALAASGLWTAYDPFAGTWTLDVSRSVIVDQMAIENAGPNAYTFRFEGGPPETIVANGTDQPGFAGTTLAIKSNGPRKLIVIRKKAGHMIVHADWTLSEDGRALHDAFTGTQQGGSPLTTDYVYHRASQGTGFAGSWESTTKPLGLKYEMRIEPYQTQGLSFVRQGSAKSFAFDGHDHAVASPVAGMTASGRRQSARVMEVTDKNKGELVDVQTYTLSRDGKTLTIEVHKPGQTTPNLFVLARV